MAEIHDRIRNHLSDVNRQQYPSDRVMEITLLTMAELIDPDLMQASFGVSVDEMRASFAPVG